MKRLAEIAPHLFADNASGRYPFHRIVGVVPTGSGEEQIVEGLALIDLLISIGANIGAVNEVGETVLWGVRAEVAAYHQGNLALVKALVEGESYFDCAVSDGNVGIADYLISKNYEIPSDNYARLADRAVRHGTASMLGWLAKNGVDLSFAILRASLHSSGTVVGTARYKARR